ncbi:MAG: PRC-barrel domain-containing protein [Rhizobiaceae bacterium]|nr:PRC-barrel domain-containing protein [Rhizobiaceae bacterium]
MFAKTISLALLSSALLAGVASAQTTWVEIEDNVQVSAFSQTADTVEDWDVYAAGAKIGEVEEVIGTDANTPTALVVDFEDNAGYGDRDDVVIPLDQFAWENNQLVLNADAAAIGAMEVWND